MQTLILCRRGVICTISCVGKVEYTRTALILRTLARCGYNTVAISPGSLDSVQDSYFVVHLPVPSPNAYLWYNSGFLNLLLAIIRRIGNIFRIVQKLAEVRPDVLLCSEPDAWLVAVFAKKLFNCRIIVDLREVYDDRALAFPGFMRCFIRWSLRVLMRELSRLTDEVIHVSPERQKIYDYLYKPGIVIGSYPEIRLFPARSNWKCDVSSEFITVIHAGALRYTYASEQLLEAMMIVSRSFERVRFVVLGGVAGTLRNANIIGYLKDKGILEFVEQVPFSEVIRRLYLSDIGVNLVLPVDTAHRLAAPQKLYEYFAASLPVVVADVPTLRRIVMDNGCGIVVDPSSPRAIAEALIQLAQDAEMRKRMGKNARKAAETEFNWERQAFKLTELVESLLGKNAS